MLTAILLTAPRIFSLPSIDLTIAASDGNPLAGSQGTLGAFEVGGGDGTAPDTVRWHVTPDQTTHYFLHCVQASSALSPKQLRMAHELFFIIFTILD